MAFVLDAQALISREKLALRLIKYTLRSIQASKTKSSEKSEACVVASTKRFQGKSCF